MAKLLKNVSKKVVIAAMRQLRSTVPEVAQYVLLANKLNQITAPKVAHIDTAAKKLPPLKDHPFYTGFAAALKAAGWQASSSSKFTKKLGKEKITLQLSVTPERNKLGSTISWETDGGGGGLFEGNSTDIQGNIDDIDAVV